MPKFYVTHVREHKVSDRLPNRLRKTLRPVTVGAVVSDDNTTLSIGAARCGKRDHFTKKTGTSLSIKRAQEKPLVSMTIEPGVDPKAILLALAPVIARGACFRCAIVLQTVVAKEELEFEHV